MEIINSNQGKNKICLNGYTYVRTPKRLNFLLDDGVQNIVLINVHCSAILKTLLQIEIPKVIHEHKHSVNYFNTIKFINFTYSYSCFNINYLFIYYML